MTLHRRILKAITHPSTPPPLLHICRSAARTRFLSALELVQSLKPQHLVSFWYFASTTNLSLIGTFGTLLCATSLDEQEAEWYRERLREYRWVLKINSENGAAYMRPAMGVLDMSLALLEEGRGIGEGGGWWGGGRVLSPGNESQSSGYQIANHDSGHNPHTDPISNGGDSTTFHMQVPRPPQLQPHHQPSLSNGPVASHAMISPETNNMPPPIQSFDSGGNTLDGTAIDGNAYYSGPFVPPFEQALQPFEMGGLPSYQYGSGGELLEMFEFRENA